MHKTKEKTEYLSENYVGFSVIYKINGLLRLEKCGR